jgi:hypothetical protein
VHVDLVGALADLGYQPRQRHALVRSISESELAHPHRHDNSTFRLLQFPYAGRDRAET